MAKAKDTAKEAPKARTSKAKEKAAEKALLQGQMAETPEPLDAEARKMRLKALIKLGKERGYLTYAEINDHLPDDVVDAESIEAIISTFSEMGIQVFDEAPAAEDLLMSDTGRSRRRRRRSRSSRPSRRCPPSTPNSAAPPTRSACTCAKWARSNCSPAKAKSRSPSASRKA